MKVSLLTGGSSNLGISLAKRLIDKIADEKIIIIVTSRTLPKSLDTITELYEYAKQHNKYQLVEFDYILVNFCDMVSVLTAYYDLSAKYPKIDFLYINSAQTSYTGVDFWQGTKDFIKDPILTVTEGAMKIQQSGLKSQDGMGLLFQGNVFGPYYLIHKLKTLLHGGKIIWVSSVSSHPKHLSFNDIELIENPSPYEGSKRLIDLLHASTYKSLKKENINQYLVNPGVFTSFVFFEYLNLFTYCGMFVMFYIARFLGSTIHTISGYNASNALISCAFNDEPQDVKVVSSTDRSGRPFIAYEEFDTTGAEDVRNYLDKLVQQWDEKLKDQIVDTRKP